MNAADRRRLTPVLGVAFALPAVLLIALWAGLGRGVHWNDTVAPAPLPTLKAAPPPPNVSPLQDFADVWEHPLFSPDRKPIVAAPTDGQTADSSNFDLTGVIILPDLRMALLRDRSSGHTLRIREGQNAEGVGVVEVKPRSVVVEAGSGRSELALKPGAAPAANAEDNAAAGPPSVQMAPGAQGDAVMAQSPQSGVAAPAQPIADDARARMLQARIEQRRRQAAAQGRVRRQQKGQQDSQQHE